MDAGADDVVLKPCETDEQLASMPAVVHRKDDGSGPVLINDLLARDSASREVTQSGESIHLSAREFPLVQALLVSPGAMLSRSELEGGLYGWGDEGESNAVESLIHALRKSPGNAAMKHVGGWGMDGFQKHVGRQLSVLGSRYALSLQVLAVPKLLDNHS